MKIQDLFRDSKHRKLFVWIYSIAAVLWLPAVILAVALDNGLFHDILKSLRWQHIVRIGIFTDAVAIMATVIITGSVIVSSPKILNKSFIFLGGLLFVSFFYFHLLQNGILDLKKGPQSFSAGSCRFEDGERYSDGELHFKQIYIGINNKFEGGRRLSTSSKMNDELGKITLPANLSKDGRLFYTLCEHPINVTYLPNLGIALTIEEYLSTTLSYPQR